MTIQEALKRYSPDRQKVSSIEQRSIKELQNRSIEIIKQAGIPQILEELRSMIEPEFPDVNIPADRESINWHETPEEELAKYTLCMDGSAFIDIGWNYHTPQHVEKPLFRPRFRHDEYSSIIVRADPQAEALIVEGEEKESIPKSIWNAEEGITILEDAIVYAYKNPSRRVTFPDRD